MIGLLRKTLAPWTDPGHPPKTFTLINDYHVFIADALKNNRTELLPVDESGSILEYALIEL